MIKAITLAFFVQASPCVNASAIKMGQLTPCTGILFSAEQAREALQCKRVELPKLKAQLKFESTRRDAIEHTYKGKILYLESSLDAERQRKPWWVTPLVGAAFLGIGYAVGNLSSAR